MISCARALSGALLLALAAGPGAAEETPVAVFDFALIDTSLQGEMTGTPEADLARAAMVTGYVRRQMADSGRFEVIDPGPTERDAHACNRCELARARERGADLALVGWVQKVSNLILNINMELRRVTDGRTLTGGSVDIRGNTEEAWLRAARAALRNTGLAPDAQLPP